MISGRADSVALSALLLALGCSGPRGDSDAATALARPTPIAPVGAARPSPRATAPACRPSPTAVVPVPLEIPITTSARVTLATSEIRANGVTPDDVRALTSAIRALHSAWVDGNAAAYVSRLAPRVTRIPPELGAIQVGSAAVHAGLPREWEAFERAGSRLALRLALRDVEVTVDGDTAIARYRVEVTGGSRWGFDDEWRVLSAFERIGARWMLVHEATATGLETSDAASGPTFRFDFVYPVRDLARALAFYRPILGEPESVDEDGATFALQGGRFGLDARALGGLASVRPGLPNGYAVIDVEHLDARIGQLRSSGVTVLDGARDGDASDATREGPDCSAVALDPSGNVFVLRERAYPIDASAAPPSAPRIETLPETPEGCAGHVRAFATAWIGADAQAIAGLHADDARLFDDAARSSSVAGGRAAIAAETSRIFAGYDRSRAGLVASLDVRSVRVAPFGRGAIASFEWTLVGSGAHPVRETSLVTQVWQRLDGGAGFVTDTFFVRAYPGTAMVRALDYTGYPVSSLRDAERFYTRVMGLGDPYRDEAYRGWWSTDAVFGVYEASTHDDGIPIARRANGYASFWVRSASDALAHLRAQGSTFPLIPAINTRRGADVEDGYVQVVATDSEGNLLLLSEYPRD